MFTLKYDTRNMEQNIYYHNEDFGTRQRKNMIIKMSRRKLCCFDVFSSSPCWMWCTVWKKSKIYPHLNKKFREINLRICRTLILVISEKKPISRNFCQNVRKISFFPQCVLLSTRTRCFVRNAKSKRIIG